MKVKPLNNQDGELAGYITGKCPGCGVNHFLRTVPLEGYACWKFNGDVENPTFAPSFLEWTGGDWTRQGATHRCHFFLRDGKLIFQSDCLHDLAGQTVEAPDITEDADGNPSD